MMRNLLDKVGAFFEAHAEKLVLGLALLVAGWVLMTCVVFSPNRVVYRDQTFSPTAIDDYISEQYAGDVEARLAAPARADDMVTVRRLDQPIRPDDPVRVGIYGELEGGFLGLLADSIRAVDDTLALPVPSPVGGEAAVAVKGGGEPRDYRLPVIGDVWDIEVEHIRAAAYVPIQPLGQDETYGQSGSEPNDIDLVSVQGSFNAAQLYRRFADSFLGDRVPEAWRDEELATPVFAAVDLQRQERLADGSWGPWQSVPRLAIENRRNLFRIVEDVKDLPPGGVHVRRLQLGRADIQADLLQPSAYSMASAYETWYPPVLHRDYTAAYDKMKKQERREQREQDQPRSTGRRGATGPSTSRSRTRAGQGQGADAYGEGAYGNTRTRGRRPVRGRPGAGGEYGAGGYGGAGPVRGRRRGAAGAGQMDPDMMGEYYGTGVETQNPLFEIDQKLRKILLGRDKDLADETDLIFWAHDDTVEPGKTYRYRLRLGILNPVAGTDYLADEFAEYRDRALLWSNFSDASVDVPVPQRTYIFASSYREDVDSLKVDVAKYLLGYWRVETFDVRPGETIGRLVETKSEDERVNPAYLAAGMEGYALPTQGREVTVEPDEIDFRTNAVYLGTSKVDAWSLSGTHLREQVLYRMLFSHDGTHIEHAPVGTANYAPALRKAYSRVQSQKRLEKEDFKSFEEPTRNRGIDPYGYGEEMLGAAY